MPTLEIYGHSDDSLETIGIPGCDEFSCYGDDDVLASIEVCTTDVQHCDKCDTDKEVITPVLVIDAVRRCTWAFAVHASDEDAGFPSWPIRRTWKGYSEHVFIECPVNAFVRLVKPKRDDEDTDGE